MRLILVSILSIVTLTASQAKDKVEYKYNSELPIVKDGWQGNLVVNGRFKNAIDEEPTSMWTAVKWKFGRNPQAKEKKSENYQLEIRPLTALPEGDAIVWLGHAGFLIQLNGIRIVVDPVLGNIPAYKRQSELPLDPSILTGIDYLLVSHDHHDHFNVPSLELLADNNPEMKALAPLGARRLFNKSKRLKHVDLQEAGWWQQYLTDQDIEIIFLPARHWGRRWIDDTNKMLWGSFLIRSGDTALYFAGDTAYGTHFAEIGEQFEIDVCMMPIGAYSPAYMMSRSHINPQETLTAFQELGAQTMIPMHYGAFDLSDEPMSEPLRWLLQLAEEEGVSDRIEALIPGEVYVPEE